jgi:hypothetical protein
VDQNGTYPSDICRLERAKDRISQHGPTQPTPLNRAIHCQPADDHHRDRIRHVPPNSARRSRVGNGARRKTIVCDDAVSRIGANDVGSRAAGRFVSQRTATQPIIKRGFAAVELGEIMNFGNWFRGPQHPSSRLFLGWHALLLPRGRCAQETTQSRVVRRPLIQRCRKLGERFGVEREEATIQQNSLSLTAGRLHHEFRAALSRRRSGTVDQFTRTDLQAKIDGRAASSR